MFHGRAAVLARHDFAAGRGEWLCESPTNPHERAAYAAEHSMRNPWFISSVDYRPGRVMTGEEILESDALIRTDFYRRCLKRLGLYHRLCGVIAHRGDIVYYVDVMRGRSQPTFDPDERSLYGSILRHLTVSLENHWTLVNERSENQALRSVMDRMASAVFVVDENARVLLANARSSTFLEDFEGLQLHGKRIAAVSRAEDRALLEAIAEVSTSSSTKIVTVSSPTGLHPIVVSIRPVGESFMDTLQEHPAAAVLIAKNPHQAHEFERCAFATIFDLTPAQARLAGLILAGRGLSDAAQLLQVSENTVRSHLKQIYKKTKTHSQIDLVHLHARVCTEHL
jgi:DNA-binding CsgD family transcriptional regulator